jgi:hypothetical protein
MVAIYLGADLLLSDQDLIETYSPLPILMTLIGTVSRETTNPDHST